jgi:hypothetical protein
MYKHKFPAEVIERDGPFDEFSKDASMVSVEISDGRIYSRVVLVYPDFIGQIYGVKELPFDHNEVTRIFQTSDNLKERPRDWPRNWRDNVWSGYTKEK